MSKGGPSLYTVGIVLLAIGFVGWIPMTLLGVFSMSLENPALILLVSALSLLLPVATCAGMAVLLVKVVFDRMGNKEDDYYSRNVER